MKFNAHAEPRIQLYGREVYRTKTEVFFRASIEQPAGTPHGVGGVEFRFSLRHVTMFAHNGRKAAMVPVRELRTQLNKNSSQDEQLAV